MKTKMNPCSSNRFIRLRPENPKNCLQTKITNTMKFVNTIKETNVLAALLVSFLSLCSGAIQAEGIKQVAPTANDAPVMLETGRAEFGDFAKFNGPANSRLYISIGDVNERVFLGLSQEYNDAGQPFPGFSAGNYSFRIRFDNGADNPVVHGPFTVTSFNANLNDWESAQFGSYPTTATLGGQLIFEFQPTQVGDYFIEFEDIGTDGNPKVNIPFWDITVANNNIPLNGRIWSRSWAFRTPQTAESSFPECVWDRPFNGDIYSYTSDGFVSRIDFQDAGLQGLSFSLAFNSKGPGASDDLTSSRQSIPNFNAALSGAEHRVFLSEPDLILFPSSANTCGDITIPGSFNCTDTGTFCLEVSVTKPGQVGIVLDFNQNGVLDPDSEDVNLLWDFQEGALSACIPWDGIRGDGTPASEGDTINIIFNYSQGVQHWSAYDIEYLSRGFCVETVRPICQPNFSSNTLYWDDRNIPQDNGLGTAKDGRNGFDCEDGVRGWNNFDPNTSDCSNIIDAATSGYGDKNTINTWWFASTSTTVQVNIPLVRGSILGNTEICEGESTTLTALSNSGQGEVTFSWTGPSGFTATTAEITVSEAGEYCVAITADMGCSADVCRTVSITDGNNGRISYPENIIACLGDQIELTPNSASLGDFTYSWTPADGLSAADIPNPIVIFNGSNTSYLVEVTDIMTGCIFRFPVSIELGVQAQASFVATQESCEAGTTVNFVNTSTNAVSYSWNFGDNTTVDDFSDLAAPAYVYPQAGSYVVTLIATSPDGCRDTIQQEITVQEGIVVDLNVPDVSSCNATFVLTPETTVAATFAYFDTGGNLLGTGPTLNVPLSGVRQVRVVATTAEGCVEQQLVTLSGGPVDISAPDEVISCGTTDINLGVTNIDVNDTLTYSWTPAEIFDPATLNSANPTFIGTPGVYNLTLNVANQFGCTATIMMGLVVLDDMAVFDFEQVADCDGLTYLFTHTGSVSFGYRWDFDGLGSSNVANPSFTFPAPGTYNVTLSSAYDIDCIAPITREVVVGEAALTADFSLSQSSCQDSSIVLDFSPNIINLTGGTLTYAWTFDNGVPASSTEENPSVVVSQNGDFTASLTVTTSTNCSASSSQVFNIQFAPLELPDDITICPGDSTNLNPNADPSVSYTWSPAIGFDPNDPNPRVGQAGIYLVTATTTAGDINCATTDSVRVTVADPIELLLSSPDGPILDNGAIELPTLFTCGSPIELSATVEANITVVFTDINGNLVGSGNTVILNPANRDTIVATATDPFGCMVMDTVLVINQQVDAAPNAAGQDITLCSTQDTTLGVINLDANDTLTYAWVDNPIINGPLDGPTVSISPDAEAGSIEIQVVVTNQFGCDTTLIFSVTVLPFEPNIFPSLVQACFNQPTELNPGGQVVGGYTYEWDPMTGDFSNPANPIVSLLENTTYSVTITDPATNCSEVQTVEVVVAPNIDFSAMPTDTSFCEAGSVTFTSTNAVGAEVTWYSDPARTIVVGTGDSFTLEVNTPGTITIYVQAVDPETGCTEELEVSATLQDFTPNIYPEAIESCYNTPTTISGGSAVAGYTYEWNPMEGDFSDPANPIVTLTTTTTYTVTVTDPVTGCSSEQSITVNVAPEIDFNAMPTDTSLCEPGSVTFTSTNAVGAEVTWYSDPARTMVVGTGNNFTLDINTPGTISIYGQAVDPQTGCTEEVVVSATLQDFSPNIYPEAIESCYNTPTTISGGTAVAGYTYEWNPMEGDFSDPANPVVTLTTTTTYTVLITDPATGCSSEQNITVNVAPEIDFNVLPSDTTLCEPGSVILTATNAVDAEVTWYSDPARTMVLGTGSNLTVTVNEPGTTTIYGQAVDPETGCTEEETVQITLSPLTDGLPDEAVDACADEDAPSLFSTGTNPAYVYTFEPAELVNLNDPDNPIWAGGGSGEVTVTVLNPATGCSLTTNVVVTITDLSGLTGIANPPSIVLGNSSELSVLGCEGCAYDWMPPNGNINPNGGATTTATPDEAGELVYDVVVSLNGCTEVVMIPLTVTDDPCNTDHVYIPNAFSPNGDGSNDVLRVRSRFIDELEEFDLMIFNRWGQEMYRSFDPLASWDGTVGGEALEPDVYGFYLRVVCPNGEELIQKGNITILR